ncbi:MAG: hypothetical protein K2H12_12725, partial [Acetatifactor sp.]|nr:hypothetical protein [Acetatifactor sp.]
LMIWLPTRSTLLDSAAASDGYKRQEVMHVELIKISHVLTSFAVIPSEGLFQKTWVPDQSGKLTAEVNLRLIFFTFPLIQHVL